MRRRWVGVLLGAALLCTAVPALAADPSPADIAQARELGGQAQAAFEAGKYADSEKLWAAAQNLYPAAPTLTLGLARTQAKLGRLVLAQESYNKIIREQGQATNLSPAFKDALEAARAEVPAVSSKLGSVVIRVDSGPATPTVTLDGQPVSAAGLGLERPVDPGVHAVHAEAPGYKPADTSFQVTSAGKAQATLTLEKGPQPIATVNTTRAGPSKLSTKQKLALGAFGVGGAAVILGAITGLVAVSKHAKLSDKCPNDTCPASLQSDYDSYKTMGTLSTIGFIVGGVGAGAGALLWFTSSNESTQAKATDARSVDWHPYVGLGGGGVHGSF